jgi:hypothetical protein
VTHKLYKNTHGAKLAAQGKKMGVPLLIRCDDSGAYGYTPPQWALAGLPALLHLLAS